MLASLRSKKIFFYKKFPLIPVSIIIKILNKFIIGERNAENILKYLNTTENFKLSKPTILKILNWFKR